MKEGTKEDVYFLLAELRAIQAALMKQELMDQRLDRTIEIWREIVREMAYVMENCIDDYMMSNFGDADAKAGFIRETAQRLWKLVERRQIAKQIKKFKALLLETDERFSRYAFHDTNTSSSVLRDIDLRIRALYLQKATDLVGIDGPRDELVRCLTDSDKNLKVVSIVGLGGLGKTTLAKQVYDVIGRQFSYKAFVSVSPKPDMARVLRDLQFELGITESSEDLAVREVGTIIERLRGHLKNERYLIVVDDLWDTPTWNILSCVFPESNNGSRVIVTTRIEHVTCCAGGGNRNYVYRMKPLNVEDSRRLLLKRAFGSEDECPSQFVEVSAQTLKKCGGLPLAITTLASLAVDYQGMLMIDWESRVRDFLSGQTHSAHETETVRYTLNLSYIDLPPDLRTCFLYLGMYPADYEIERDVLIRQWIAEGFVSYSNGQDTEKTAKSNFKELINRNLVQPDRTHDGEVLSCRVHGAMHDFILFRCNEDKFIRISHNSEDIPKFSRYTHRLSLNWSAGDAPDSTKSATMEAAFPEVRSLAWFGESSHIPPLSLFNYARVLVVEIPWSSADKDKTVIDLTIINQLLRLRYLKVSTRQRIKNPARIEGLDRLETLELDCRFQQGTVVRVARLPRLSQLIVPKYRLQPEGIGNMKSLCTLHWFDLGNKSSTDIMVLGELTKLTDLRISNHTKGHLATTAADALVSSIGKLRNLRYLRIDDGNEGKDDKLSSLSGPPPHIEELELGGWLFFKFPNWISDLSRLSRLDLRVWEMSTDDVNVLGGLDSLVHLSFSVYYAPKDGPVIVSKELLRGLECKELFKALVHLEFRSREDAAAYLSFEEGAMPLLRILTLQFQERHWRGPPGAAPAGMKHLLGLEQIHVGVISGRTEPALQVCRDTESAFMNAIQVHRRKPSFSIHGLSPNKYFW